jgi:hypothetical protein
MFGGESTELGSALDVVRGWTKAQAFDIAMIRQRLMCAVKQQP